MAPSNGTVRGREKLGGFDQCGEVVVVVVDETFGSPLTGSVRLPVRFSAGRPVQAGLLKNGEASPSPSPSPIQFNQGKGAFRQRTYVRAPDWFAGRAPDTSFNTCDASAMPVRAPPSLLACSRRARQDFSPPGPWIVVLVPSARGKVERSTSLQWSTVARRV